MEIRRLCTLAAFLFIHSLGLFVQVLPTTPQYTEYIHSLTENSESSDRTEDVFSRILKTNEANMNVEYQGDIVLGSARSATTCETCTWRKRGGHVPIPYTLSSNYTFGQRALILEAMQEFGTLTCIQFVRQSKEVNYIAIEPVNGCWSFIGMVGGRQVLSLLPSDCMSRGIIQHELCHSLGFHHEQARSDRDKYITVLTENIDPGNLHHFAVADTHNLGFKYDYESVMHYSVDAFSNTPGKATMKPKAETSVRIGQRYGLSFMDVQKINRLYKCDVCTTLLSAVTGKLAFHNNRSNHRDNVNCTWLIRAPFQQVFLKFEKLDIRLSPGCNTAYLKIYDGVSRSAPVLLKKSCGTEKPPPLMASSNMMLVEFFSKGRLKAKGFKASYSTVKCGNAFHKSPATFTSPGYPGNYESLLDCLWLITAPKGHTIYLTIKHLDLEKARYCMYDYLSVFNGDDASSELLGKYCGNRNDTVRVSTGSSMLILLHTDSGNNRSGFKAWYKFVPTRQRQKH